MHCHHFCFFGFRKPTDKYVKLKHRYIFFQGKQAAGSENLLDASLIFLQLADMAVNSTIIKTASFDNYHAC